MTFPDLICFLAGVFITLFLAWIGFPVAIMTILRDLVETRASIQRIKEYEKLMQKRPPLADINDLIDEAEQQEAEQQEKL